MNVNVNVIARARARRPAAARSQSSFFECVLSPLPRCDCDAPAEAAKLASRRARGARK